MIHPSTATKTFAPRGLLLYYGPLGAYVDHLAQNLQRHPPPSQASTFVPASPLPPTSGTIVPDVSPSPPPDALRTPTEAARKPRKPRKPTPEYLATLANKP